MPKRILYVEQNFDGTVGGSHKIMVDLVTRLPDAYEPVVMFYEENRWAAHLRDAGYEVHIWDGRAEYERSRAGGKLGTLRRLVSGISKRKAFLKEHRIDAVQLNNAPFVGADVWVPAAKAAGVYVMTYAMGWGPPSGSVDRWIQRKFDYVFPLSLVIDETLEELGLDPAKRVMAYPGIDAQALREREYRPASEVRSEFGVAEDRLLAVMVGNIREWKGQVVVVEAVAALPPEIRDRLHLLMVGDTGDTDQDRAYAQSVEALIEKHGLSDTIVLTGRRLDVPDILEAADIAIHASLQAEPFGLVVLEGMAHGCAMIADGRGGPAEMIVEGTGLKFDSGRPEELTRALEQVVGDDAARTAMAAAARERAAEFDQSAHVKVFEETYAKLFGNTSR